jgi:hypothetical protein
VFTRLSGSKLRFIAWRCDSMLEIGHRLRRPTTEASTHDAMRAGRGVCAPESEAARSRSARGRSLTRTLSSKHAIAGTIVSQLRKERLPLTMRVAWNATSRTPATCLARRGPNAKNGTTSSTTWLKSTPRVWTHAGAWWRSHARGFGFGCVS